MIPDRISYAEFNTVPQVTDQLDLAGNQACGTRDGRI